MGEKLPSSGPSAILRANGGLVRNHHTAVHGRGPPGGGPALVLVLLIEGDMKSTVLLLLVVVVVVLLLLLDAIALPIVEDTPLLHLLEHVNSPHEEEVLVLVVNYHREEEVLVPGARSPPVEGLNLQDEADYLLPIPISVVATITEETHLLATEILTIERAPTKFDTKPVPPKYNRHSPLRPTFASQTLTQSDFINTN